MATSIFPKNRNRCSLSTLSLFLIFLFCLFLFSRRLIEPNLFLYRDFISQTPVPLLSPPRSTEFVDKFDDLREPVLSDPVENEEESNEEITPQISSNSDKNTEKTTTPLVSSEVESKGDLGEITDEPMSSNVKTNVPISSKSDLDVKTRVKQVEEVPLPDTETIVQDSSKSGTDDVNSDGDLGEITDVPMSSNVKTNVPISSKSDLDGKTRETQVEGGPSSDSENGGFVDNEIAEKLRNCDVYQGKWVKDEGYPLYRPGSCPYVDEAFDCQNNGRPDSEYLKWRWKPDGCDLPRFNAKDFLVRLRGKKLMLVGDSMNRNQFESLLCLLREGLPDKSKMYEVHGYKITKGRGYYVFKFEEYNCTVEFVRSHFLVREGVRVNAQGNSNPTLSIDRIDKTARRWLSADILVFNTGHWWTHGKTSRGKNYYKEGDYIYPRFDAVEAYRKAIKTWATWIKKNLAKDKLVFYRGYSSAHFRGGDWDSGGTCNGETEPVKTGAIINSYPQKMTIVEDVIEETEVPAVLLNVTHLTNYRKDGHPSVYGKNVTGGKKVSTRRQDCSHWCLPGVPDAWNELIYATLVGWKS